MELTALLPVLPFQAILFFCVATPVPVVARTIQSAGLAISFLHKLRGMPDPMGSFLVTKYLL